MIANIIIVWVGWFVLITIPPLVRPKQAKYEVAYIPIITNIGSVGDLIGEVLVQWVPTGIITYALMSKGWL